MNAPLPNLFQVARIRYRLPENINKTRPSFPNKKHHLAATRYTPRYKTLILPHIIVD